jgi:formyl-CoA transferase
MLRISGYGQTGPYRDLPGFAVVAEAMGGMRHLMASRAGRRCAPASALGDTLAALHGVIGVLLALQARSSASADAPKGRGQVVDVALYESVFNCMESLLPEYSAFGAVRQPAAVGPARHRPEQRLPLRRRPWWSSAATAIRSSSGS